MEQFTRHVIYGDNKSSTIAEAHATKWDRMMNKYFTRFPPDADSLLQHCLRANYLAYLMRHPSLKHHPSPLGHGWELVGAPCRPVRHTRPPLPTHIPAPGQAEESGEDESEEEDDGEGDDAEQMRSGIHLNLFIQKVVKQNALILADHISQCHIDSSATMS